MGARVERSILGSVAPVAAAQSVPLHMREAARAVPRCHQLLSREHLGGNVDRCLLTPTRTEAQRRERTVRGGWHFPVAAAQPVPLHMREAVRAVPR